MLISGPVSLNVLYSKEDNQYIYVFGDIHEDLKYMCHDKNNLIWDFMYNLIINNPNYFFNVFVETYQSNEDTQFKKNNVDVIYNIIYKFKTFVNDDIKQKKISNNSLIHYVDYRIIIRFLFINNKFNPIYRYVYYFYNDIELIDYILMYLISEPDDDINLIIKYINGLNDIFNTFKTENKIKTIEDYVDIFFSYIKYSKINKQYIRIHNKTHLYVIYDFTESFKSYILNKHKNVNITKCYNIISNTVKKYNLQNLNNLRNINIKTIFTTTERKHLIHLYNFNFELQTVLMDLYVLGRTLRVFKEEKAPEFINTPKITLLYVGNYHAQLYNNIFTMMGFKLKYSATRYNNLKRCIKIKDEAFTSLFKINDAIKKITTLDK
jgi:hypothetical protein